MLENLYTTKMSANKKTLQNRFSKIRSKSGWLSKIMALVMSAVMVVTFACATVVMAAVGADGLERWDKEEVYFLAGVRGDITADAGNMPEWAKNISSDGKINVFIQRVDIRNTTGIVEHMRIVRLIGDLDTIDLVQNSTCGYDDENGEKILLVFDTSHDEENPYGKINPNAVYIKLLNDNDYEAMSDSGMDFEYFISKIENGGDGFIQLKNTEQLGDFVKFEDMYWNSIFKSYYTSFETVFKNRKNENINLSAAPTPDGFIKVKAEVKEPSAYYLEVFICPPQEVTRIGFQKSYKLSEINGELQCYNLYSKNSFKEGKTFEKGETYVVNYVLKDREEKVIYRQQDYINIPQ